MFVFVDDDHTNAGRAGPVTVSCRGEVLNRCGKKSVWEKWWSLPSPPQHVRKTKKGVDHSVPLSCVKAVVQSGEPGWPM